MRQRLQSLASARGAATFPLREASWILVGAILGTTLCCQFAGSLAQLDTSGAVSLASFAMSALMFASVHDPAQPSGLRTSC
jgi:hypothetical protein